jgi:hypothetical protein
VMSRNQNLIMIEGEHLPKEQHRWRRTSVTLLQLPKANSSPSLTNSDWIIEQMISVFREVITLHVQKLHYLFGP